jgi:hypothetical protein
MDDLRVPTFQETTKYTRWILGQGQAGHLHTVQGTASARLNSLLPSSCKRTASPGSPGTCLIVGKQTWETKHEDYIFSMD